MANSKRPTPNILLLPEELRYQILSSSADIPSLRALALSCPELYRTFVNREREITTTVLSRHIHPEVAYDARIALAASRLPRKNMDAVSKFVQEYLIPEKKELPDKQWNLTDALAAYHLHTQVAFFTQTLARRILRQPPFTTPNAPDTPSITPQSLSERELHRFERALYRFQTLCILFQPQIFDNVVAVWFSQLARFELEQLACIDDLLTYMIAPAFNAMALHDVSWGSEDAQLVTDVSNGETQYILSRGLEYIRSIVQISETETETEVAYAQYSRILCRGQFEEDEIYFVHGFIYDKLECQHPFHAVEDEDDQNDDDNVGEEEEEEEEEENDYAIYNDVRYGPTSIWTAREAIDFPFPLPSLRPSVQRRILGTPFYPPVDYEDPGPARVFSAFHIDTPPGSLVQNTSFVQHRCWAYVFWDEARLVRIGALSAKRKKYEKIADKDLPIPPDPLQVYKEIPDAEMKASRDRRREIARQGGRGWWSAEDESKVVWPKPKKQQKEEVQVQSMQEAKDFLRGLVLPGRS